MAAPVALLAARALASPTGRRRVAIALLVTAIGAVTSSAVMAGVIVAVAGLRDPATATRPAAATTGIPPDALDAYHTAANTYGVDWAIIAAIGWEECRHGTSRHPGCLPDTVNPAGARGYMQFIGSTWRTSLGQHQLEPRTSPPAPHGHGYATDGDGDGDADPWSWPDAAHSAARYLDHLGIHHGARAAVYGYNHDHGYVDRVLATADRYRTTSSGDSVPPLTTVQGITVNTRIADDLDALLTEAAADGIHLAGSGYRSPQRQIELRRAHCGTSHHAIYDMPSSQCTPPTARPGTSMHEQGLAIDFTCNGQVITARTSPCYQWLTANAAAYGLHELASGAEPWHWSVDGS